MAALLWLLVALFILGAAIGAYALLAPRRSVPALPAPAPEPAPEPLRLSTSEWTSEAGHEFAGLSESARCDLIFAVAALEDERSHRLLAHALDDPADPVALAAAHALARNGHREDVVDYARTHPGVRADTLERTLSLLD
ncbi:MAG TPA: hypothetical protein VIG32_07340 [Candidatus Baltobacteraceae bacterium]|jgi:hypothetical protein